MAFTEKQAAEIQSIELRIVELLQQDRYRWQELAQLALRVRREKLYIERGIHSFTAWIKAIANASGRQPSLFWRYLKAAVYYLRQVESEDIERISEIKAAPEALDRLEKIERQAPRPVFEAMRDKVLAGEATVLECRHIEKQYRPEDGSSNRGRPVRELEGNYSYLGQWKNAPEEEPELESSQQTVKPEHISTSLKEAIETHVLTWSRDCAGQPYVARNYALYQNITVPFSVETTIEALVVARWDLEQPKDLLGVSTKSCIADFDTDHNWSCYLHLCHYFSFAIPKHDVALRELLSSTIPRHVGILLVDVQTSDRSLRQTPLEVARRPQRVSADASGIIYETLFDEVMGWKKS